MNKTSHCLAAVIILLWFIAMPAWGDKLIGEVGLAAGAIYPQGNLVRYADPGPNFWLRVNSHPSRFAAFSGWFDISGTFFSSDEEGVFLEVDDVQWPGKRRVSEYAFSLHFGLQLGSDSRIAFFRPRAALAPGLYLFNTETSFRLLDYDEDLDSESDLQLRVGWRGIIGTDLFFSTKWGISLSYIHDQVFHLQHTLARDKAGNLIESSKPGRFDGFMVGVVIPFEQIPD
ncbi:MAG: hypothetical protein JSV44_10440 [Candidatus Zixiibacteriota bacterium]|nr:MAG: hypothetical protein JSV44_10440 [candidate division Zixibacteria bacterium]